MSAQESRRGRGVPLSGLSPSERGDLLEEARRRARERVLSLLIDELTELMLGQMRGKPEAKLPAPLGAPPPEERQPELRPPARPAEDGTGWYVYGVIAADDEGPVSLPGIDPVHETTTVREGVLAAVVSRVPLADFDEEPLRERLTDMRWLEHTARAHEEVLERIGRQRTLIPMRICSIYRDARGVRDMLRREERSLRGALEHLRGRTEWGVKVFTDRPALARPADASAETGLEESSVTGTDYLRQRQQERRQLERADQELEDVCHQIHSSLEAIAADALTLPVQRPEVTGHPGEMILNGAYLVSDEDHGQLVTEIGRLRERYGELDLVLTGPWPAYNFVAGAIGAGL